MNRRAISKITRDSGGASAAEFAMVLPLLVLLFFGIVQYGLLFFAYNNLNNAAREAARAFAVGEVTTEADAEDLAEELVATWLKGDAVADANSAATNGTEFVSVEITAPGSKAAILGIAPVPATLRAEVFMREE